MLEAGIGEPEVIEPMIERRPRDGDAELAHIGEVGQSDPAGLMCLAEDNLLLVPVDRAPGLNPPLQSATNPGSEIGMAPEHLLEDRDGSQAGRHLQHRYDLSGKNVGKGVRTTASAHPLLLRGQRSRCDRPWTG